MSLNKTAVRLILSSTVMGLLATNLFAGSSAGNGGDIHPPYFYHAWFGGTKKIPRYCYTVSPDFGVTPSQIESTVEWAFNQWVEYLKIKRLDGYKVAQRIDRMGKCDGSEDMRLYLGTSDALVEKLKKAYQDPVAFSEKTQYDHFAGWGKGVLWVSGPRKIGYSNLSWANLDNFKGILLHEMGHVFGNPHISNTIMDSELAFRVLNEGGHSGSALNLPLTSIDGRMRELVSCYNCTYEFECGGHAQLQTRFEKLLGKKPEGQATAVLKLQEGHKKTGVVTLKDNKGSYDFPVEVEKQIVWRNGDALAFNVISPSEEPSNGAIGTGNGVWFGWMTTPKGEKLPISLSRNLSYGAEIVDLDGPVLLNKEDDSDFFHGHTFRIVK